MDSDKFETQLEENPAEALQAAIQKLESFHPA